MSHSVKITIIADQGITILGKDINIHDLKSLTLNSNGGIIGYLANDSEEKFNYSEDYFKESSKEILGETK